MEDRKRETQSQCGCHSSYHVVNRLVGGHQSPASDCAYIVYCVYSFTFIQSRARAQTAGLCTFSLLMRQSLFPRLRKLYQKSLLRVKTLPPHNLNNGRMRKRRKKGSRLKRRIMCHMQLQQRLNVAYSWKTETPLFYKTPCEQPPFTPPTFLSRLLSSPHGFDTLSASFGTTTISRRA